MQMTGHSYSSGEWLVRPGSEEEFIQRWTTFVEWSLDNAEGLSSSFWFGARKSPGSSSLWERGRANRLRRRGERCPRCRSYLASAGRCATSTIPTDTPWRLGWAG
jgi:hypothetical protein